MSGFTIVNLHELEDMAPRFGLDEIHEARFATQPLDCEQTGLAYYRIKPGRRQPFSHRHRHQEEIYVVIGGGGRVKLDDELRELAPGDAVRVAAETRRCFEAGSDGLEMVAFGARIASGGESDAELVSDHWTD